MEPGAPIFNSAEQMAEHRPVTDAVHAAGGRIALQILHAGRYARIPGAVGPSTIASPINSNAPRRMSEADILRTIEDYAATAALAREAGYDGVEIMGSEGYLINEFTAPRTNDRTDVWGGSMENRLRLGTEIMRRVRARVGRDFLVVFRVSSIDLVQGGLTAEEIAAEAQGRGGRRRRHHQPGHRLARGARADDCAESAARRLGVRGAATEGGGAHPRHRLQPHQHARRSPKPSWRVATPTSCRWRGRCWPTPSSPTRRARAAPTRSTCASPATRRASI